jgi:Flp pilus assembly protein TadG
MTLLQTDRSQMAPRTSREKGFTTIVVACSLLAMMGAAGIAIDLGRTYYVKSEVQAFCDAAALAAAYQLDGAGTGITGAQAAVTTAKTQMKWDIGTKTISSTTVTFAKGQTASPNKADSTTWTANPASADDYRFVQVFATVDAPLTFMQTIQVVLGNSNATTTAVTADAIAAQAMITDYPAGLLPFSPIAPAPTSPDDFGLTRSTANFDGPLYTMRYPAPGGQKKGNVCSGDQNQTYWSNLPSQDRGFWGSTSASALRGEIIDDSQASTIVIGDPVPMVGGNKNTEGGALATRVLEDSDSTSATYSAYISGGKGNGRRIVGLPINSGPTVVPPYTSAFTAVGIGAFFLQTADVYNAVSGIDPICGQYIGPYVQGRMGSGAGQTSNPGSTGGYVVRLVN